VADASEYPGWADIGPETDHWRHDATNVELWRERGIDFWQIRIPRRPDDVVMSFGYGPAKQMIHNAEMLHTGRLLRERADAWVEGMSEYYGRKLDELMTRPREVENEEWARRAFKRVQYDTLCALQAYGLGAYGRQRIEAYAEEQGFRLPGMAP
jgi:hypothetical protein